MEKLDQASAKFNTLKIQGVEMSALIAQTGTLWQGANGKSATWITDGSPVNAIEASADLKKLQPPKREIESFLILEDGTRVALPFCGLTYRLPDRTGVVAIFEPGQYLKPDGTDYFPYPNNAAIFNADGSLRFQLVQEDWYRIGAIHSGSMPAKFDGKMGLLIAATPQDYPELVYAVDPESPKLISTLQQIRY